MPFSAGTKCFLFAWVPAWGAWVMLSSALVALLDLSPAAQDCGLACTMAVADAVSPSAKLAIGACLGALMLSARRHRPTGLAMMAGRDAAAAAAAVTFALAVLPQSLSSGFGIGLSGERFSPGLTAIYLVAAVVAGIAGAMLERSCRGRLLDPPIADS